MSTEDSTYAPRSPDLSFLSGSDLPSNSTELPQISPPTNLYYQTATDRVPVALGATQSQPHHLSQFGYQPQSTEVPAKPAPTSTPAGAAFFNNNNHNNNYDQHQHHQFSQYANQYPFHQQPVPQPHTASYPPQHHSPVPSYGNLQTTSSPRSYYAPYPGPTSVAAHYPTSQPQTANSAYSLPTSQDPYYQAHPSTSGSSVPQSRGTPNSHLAATQETLPYGQQFPAPNHSSAMPPRKAAQAAVKQPEIMESPVRTKFPTARIKRIMQADDEVGKVAQQTPIAVGKALELFMVQLVSKSAEVAKEKNSKRISAQMLKQAVESANEWDFLQEIVAKVSEKEESSRSAAGKARQESESDEEVEVEVKKRGRGGGRKRKAAAT